MNLELNLQEGESTQVSIVDVMGKVVYYNIINVSNATLNLRELASGIYSITILKNENTKSFKIMKQ